MSRDGSSRDGGDQIGVNDQFDEAGPSNPDLPDGKDSSESYEFPTTEFLQLLTTYLYKLQRHSWGEVCWFREQLISLCQDEYVKRLLSDKNAVEDLEFFLAFYECIRGDYFGEYLSDDSDDAVSGDNDAEGIDVPGVSDSCDDGAKSEDQNEFNVYENFRKAFIDDEAFKNDFIDCINSLSDSLGFFAPPSGFNLDVESVFKLRSDIKNWLSESSGIPEDSLEHSRFIGMFWIRIKGDNLSSKAKKNKKAFSKLTNPKSKNLFSRIVLLPEVVFYANYIESIELAGDVDEINGKIDDIFELALGLEDCFEKKIDKTNINPLRLPAYHASEEEESQLALYNLLLNHRSYLPEVFIQYIESIEMKHCVILARGITYLMNTFNQSARRAHRRMNEDETSLYSNHVYDSAGVNIFQHDNEAMLIASQEYDRLDEHAVKLRKFFSHLDEIGPIYEGEFVFNTLSDYFQHNYSNKYDSIQGCLSFIKKYMIQLGFEKADVSVLKNTNPLLSFGDTLTHPLRYAYGIKPYKGHESKRLRPRWNKEGRPERPYSGKVYIRVVKLSNLSPEFHRFVPWLNRKRRVIVHNDIVTERESSFFAYLSRDEMEYGKSIVIRYPSFHSEYKFKFLSKYGMTKVDYEAFQRAMNNSLPHSLSRKYIKRLLGRWLYIFKEMQLTYQEFEEVIGKNLLPVYQTKSGYSFTSQSVKIDSGRVGFYERRFCKDLFEARKSLSKYKAKSKRKYTPSPAVEKRVRSKIDNIRENSLTPDKVSIQTARGYLEYFVSKEGDEKCRWFVSLNDQNMSFDFSDLYVQHLNEKALTKIDVNLIYNAIPQSYRDHVTLELNPDLHKLILSCHAKHVENIKSKQRKSTSQSLKDYLSKNYMNIFKMLCKHDSLHPKLLIAYADILKISLMIWLRDSKKLLQSKCAIDDPNSVRYRFVYHKNQKKYFRVCKVRSTQALSDRTSAYSDDLDQSDPSRKIDFVNDDYSSQDGPSLVLGDNPNVSASDVLSSVKLEGRQVNCAIIPSPDDVDSFLHAVRHALMVTNSYDLAFQMTREDICLQVKKLLNLVPSFNFLYGTEAARKLAKSILSSVDDPSVDLERLYHVWEDRFLNERPPLGMTELRFIATHWNINVACYSIRTENQMTLQKKEDAPFDAAEDVDVYINLICSDANSEVINYQALVIAPSDDEMAAIEHLISQHETNKLMEIHTGGKVSESDSTADSLDTSQPLSPSVSLFQTAANDTIPSTSSKGKEESDEQLVITP